jgi:hypothetical protein
LISGHLKKYFFVHVGERWTRFFENTLSGLPAVATDSN